jgi:photosystem II stability/assembly factor-like uncharacterized protein
MILTGGLHATTVHCCEPLMVEILGGVKPFIRESILVLFYSLLLPESFFNNNLKGWVVAHHKRSSVILGTENGGQSWKIRFRVPLRLSSLHNIWFVDEKHGWAVGEAEDKETHGGIIYGTKDGGKTWTLQYKGNDKESFLHEVRFADTLNGWAVGDEAVLYTSDGGATWQRQNIPKEAFFFGVDIISAKEV